MSVGTDLRRVVAVNSDYASDARERQVLAGSEASFTRLTLRPGDDQATIQALKDADAVMVREFPLPAPVLRALPRCQVIVRYGVGVDNIDLGAARERGIYVANVPDYGMDEVAEHALALLLTVARRTKQRHGALLEGAWGVGQREPVFRLAGSTLGIVGYGRIAQAFHRKAGGLGFARVLIHDPARTAPVEGAELVPLPTLLREADAVSLHVPLLPTTYHLIGPEELSGMKPGAILVNTGRGGVVDETALYHALKDGQLLGAGLDVFEQEPVAPGHPLLSLPNVTATDHTAWYSEASVDELQHKAAAEVARVLGGDAPRNWVNREVP